jgi:hypothetical protein
MREREIKPPPKGREVSYEGLNINPITPINIIPRRAPASPPPPPRRPRETVTTE